MNFARCRLYLPFSTSRLPAHHTFCCCHRLSFYHSLLSHVPHNAHALVCRRRILTRGSHARTCALGSHRRHLDSFPAAPLPTILAPPPTRLRISFNAPHSWRCLNVLPRGADYLFCGPLRCTTLRSRVTYTASSPFLRVRAAARTRRVPSRNTSRALCLPLFCMPRCALPPLRAACARHTVCSYRYRFCGSKHLRRYTTIAILTVLHYTPACAISSSRTLMADHRTRVCLLLPAARLCYPLCTVAAASRYAMGSRRRSRDTCHLCITYLVLSPCWNVVASLPLRCAYRAGGPAVSPILAPARIDFLAALLTQLPLFSLARLPFALACALCR